MKSVHGYRTEQEAFWAGNFGDEYIDRNRNEALLAGNLAFFAKALRSAGKPESCLEFGANVGMNLRALRLLFPALDCHGIEINVEAARGLGDVIPAANVHNCSILDFLPDRTWDLVLIKGVLIHIDPGSLPAVYERLAAATGKHLLIAEYYNPVPTAIPYRGHADRLYKRDFAGEILDMQPTFKLVDYGFVYRRDPAFPLDDITWFLLRKE